ncbi:ribonuclease H-like YkuK family protein [Gorillibacterium sp. sgz5001074]|uniref:ribonuclease H-like YkuK family protein n=1 Tax=Gorillibacterium sp. sgz5001074 TaxID=3446695 RepID=UPI003F6707C3
MTAGGPFMERQEEVVFQNISERRLTLEDVFLRVRSFMQREPKGSYRFIVGTDCQAHASSTTFVTGMVIHRLGNGAWACYRKLVLPRRVYSIRQKLTMETTISEEIITAFGMERVRQLEDIVLPHVYQGASFGTFVDIDAGSDEMVNRTAPFVMEMVRRVEAMGVTARIKPEAVIASAYANRYTKSGGNTRRKNG